jgi:hypothetical protein
MTKTNRKKRSKLTRIIAAPFLAMVFLVGWTLTYISIPKTKHQQKPISQTPQNHEDTIEFMVIPQEEQTVKC